MRWVCNMKKHIISQLMIGMWIATLFGCSVLRQQSIDKELITRIESAAIVSFTVNNYGNKLNYSGNIHTSRPIQYNMMLMVNYLEKQLGVKWKITPVENVIKNPQYIAAGNKKKKRGRFWRGVIIPTLDSYAMQVFTTKRKPLIRGILDASTAQKLCNLLNVDAIVLFYSEWHVATGKWAPINKALTKNLLAIYNSNGNRVFFDRKDVMGRKAVGINMDSKKLFFLNEETTIQEWVKSTNKAVDLLLE